MRVFTKKNFDKAVRGAVMFQVLLGLGLMVLMSPMIFSQIKKYNEDIKREEVVHDLEKWQKAATSFIVFEKDVTDETNQPRIPNGAKSWCNDSGCNLSLNPLREYMGSATISEIPEENGLGQKYALVTNRNGDAVEAVVIAYGGGLNQMKLNGIGQYIFDKGAVMVMEGDNPKILSDKLELSPALMNVLRNYVNAGGAEGLIFMYVTDAFFSDDYLHPSPMAGDSNNAQTSYVNTMLVDLNMNTHDLLNVKDFDANEISISDLLLAKSFSVENLTLKMASMTTPVFEYQHTEGLPAGNMPVTVGSETGPGEVEFSDELTVNNDAEFKQLDMKEANLTAKEFTGKNFVVKGDVSVTGSGTNTWAGNGFKLSKLQAGSMSSQNGTQTDSVKTIILDEPVDTGEKLVESYVYSGKLNLTEPEKVTLSGYAASDPYELLNYVALNLAGVSEVDDICTTGGSCISDVLVKYYKTLQKYLERYLNCGNAKADRLNRVVSAGGTASDATCTCKCSDLSKCVEDGETCSSGGGGGGSTPPTPVYGCVVVAGNLFSSSADQILFTNFYPSNMDRLRNWRDEVEQYCAHQASTEDMCLRGNPSAPYFDGMVQVDAWVERNGNGRYSLMLHSQLGLQVEAARVQCAWQQVN